MANAKFKSRLALFCSFGALVSISAAAQETHEHGRWDLFAALDGAALTVNLSGPMEDVVGFEHAPETEAEHDALKAFVAAADGDPMVAVNGDAGCSADGAELKLPEDFEGHEDHDDHGDHDHHDDDHDDDDHGDDDHDHDHSDSNFNITYSFSCNSPDALESLDFTGFSIYEAVENVDAVYLSDRGQKAQRLTRSAARFSLK